MQSGLRDVPGDVHGVGLLTEVVRVPGWADCHDHLGRNDPAPTTAAFSTEMSWVKTMPIVT